VEDSDDKVNEDGDELLEDFVDVFIAKVTVAVFELRAPAGWRLISEVLLIVKV
jgi:hypothetical protein